MRVKVISLLQSNLGGGAQEESFDFYLVHMRKPPEPVPVGKQFFITNFFFVISGFENAAGKSEIVLETWHHFLDSLLRFLQFNLSNKEKEWVKNDLAPLGLKSPLHSECP